MKSITVMTALLAIPFLFSAAPRARAAEQIYLTIQGSTQKFKGESTREGHTDQIPALAYEYEARQPHDAATGQASGKQTHSPLSITKAWGSASPQLFQALVTDENLPKVEISFVGASADGREQVIHTITLDDARVEEIRQFTADDGAGKPSSRKELEQIFFEFHKIDFGQPSAAIPHLPGAPGAEFYVSVRGAQQGQFTGESSAPAHHQEFPATNFHYDVSSSIDATTGQAAGKVQRAPITFVKEWGPATQQLLRANAANEMLPAVQITFVQVDRDGQSQVYSTINLKNAVVDRVKLYTSNPPAAADASASTRPLHAMDVAEVTLIAEQVDYQNAPPAAGSAIGSAEGPALFYATIVGKTPGEFKGDGSGALHKDQISGLRFYHDIKTPHDPTSGQATGHAQHSVVVMTKAWSAANTQLLQARATNEVLPSVTFDFFRTNASGEEALEETVHLKNAVITDVKQYSDDQNRELDDIAFSYQTIELSDSAGKTIASGDAAGPLLSVPLGREKLLTPVNLQK